MMMTESLISAEIKPEKKRNNVCLCVIPGLDGGSKDKPFGGEHEYLRDNRQQQALPQRVHHPLPQQNRPTGGKNSHSGHTQELSRVQRRPTQARGRSGKHAHRF